MSGEDQNKWTAVVGAEAKGLRDALAAWSTIADKQGVMRQALSTVTERGAALRLLLILDDDLKQTVFSDLIDLAAVGHSDIGLCRTVIKSIPRLWLLEHVESEVTRILDQSEDEEAYRRYAELYREIDDQLVQALVARARMSADPNILEVADDFRLPH